MEKSYNKHVAHLPIHLLQYVVDQNYDHYTAIDQAVWRYVMRQNVNYLPSVCHGSYLEGLQKTGLSIEEIPSMYGMTRILKDIGWFAVAVDGFIPPTVFMEFQAHNVLVIAADIRQINHIGYTPAPDILHEAAGHAPIIADSEYSAYLKKFGEIGSKAFSSSYDIDLFNAIRDLSILKEAPKINNDIIQKAEEKVLRLQSDMSELSEMAKIRNLHWWTVEYGLIGTINNPKIYGAGLLSSVGESQNCLKSNVKKIPLTIDCINYSYDITEQQPQLFVAKDFSDLVDILNEFEKTMAFNKINFTDNKFNEKQYDDDKKISTLNITQNNNQNNRELIGLYQSFYNKEIEEKKLLDILNASYPNEWLLRYEIYKNSHKIEEKWVKDLSDYLNNYQESDIDLNNAIKRGLNII